MNSVSGSIRQAIAHEKAKQFVQSIMYWSRALEEGGDSDGLVDYRLGHALITGIGVEKNRTKGGECFLRSAQAGHGGALAACFYYGFGTFKRKRLTAANLFVAWLQIESDDPIAKFMLGELYLPQSFSKLKAKACFEAASDAGHPGAMVALAKMYRDGDGVQTDWQTSASYLKLAAETGYATGQFLYGFFLRYESEEQKVSEEVVKLFRSAMDQGSQCAMLEMSFLYESGEGVAKNMEEANRLYEAASGPATGEQQYLFAMSFLNGKKEREAFRRFRFAAESGHANAMYSLGVSYSFGIGTEMNLRLAIVWYEKAVEKGHLRASARLAECYECQDVVRRDTQQAIDLLFELAGLL